MTEAPSQDPSAVPRAPALAEPVERVRGGWTSPPAPADAAVRVGRYLVAAVIGPAGAVFVGRIRGVGWIQGVGWVREVG